MFSDQRISSGPASQLADAINTFSRLHPENYFALDTVTYQGGNETPQPRLWVRLRNDPTKDPVTELANSAEIAHCTTDTGRLVDIFLGKPEERDIKPAIIFLEEEK